MTVSVTIDVDGEAGLPGGGAGYAQRLSSRSERLYGLRRGLPRIVDALAEFELRATFYLPGAVAQAHPDELRGLLDAGHEVGHHGHTHRRPDELTPAEQRAELVDGLAALAALTGAQVRGYRAPGWELTPATLRALTELGFTHDSSLMGDDRPYLVGGLVELPVHWTLDDAPHFERTTDPDPLLRCWLAELACATAEQRHITYTLHPEVLGRPHRLPVLQRLLEAARESAPLTHSEAAALVRR
jgi:peptidoglycan-N-acetylglucosamine deacetylase